jgi:TPP-dependent pyruvate/acetoin dehydrogenase alpha subunit
MLNKNTLLDLYSKMFTVRAVESAIQEFYSENEMKTPMHMSMGSEAISAALCQVLGDRGRVFGTYRSHALYLSQTDDIEGFMLEMYGKSAGVCMGKGGSMHLLNPKKGFMGTSAIVGGILPIAVGYAFSSKFQNKDEITAVLFGDGATNEGSFWEAFNLACVKKIPILFVCEDNALAVHTDKSLRNGYSGSIASILSHFNCHVYQYQGTNVEVMYTILQKCVEDIHKDSMPAFLHFHYYRYLQHVGVDDDFDKGYRDKKEFEKWFQKDPISVAKTLIFDQNIGSSAKDIEDRIKLRVGDSITAAKKACFSEPFTMIEGVYYDN